MLVQDAKQNCVRLCANSPGVLAHAWELSSVSCDHQQRCGPKLPVAPPGPGWEGQNPSGPSCVTFAKEKDGLMVGTTGQPGKVKKRC